MRKALPIFVLLLAGLTLCTLSCGKTRNLDPRSTWSPQEGYGFLIKTQHFAFGGIGFGGVTSTSEYAFRAVLQSSNADELFKAIFSQATEEGKLYALCGIRVTDPSTFDSYATALMNTTGEVTILYGCEDYHETVATVVKRISDGVYDSYFAE